MQMALRSGLPTVDSRSSEILERRLLEVRQAVHVGDHPIAALEHLLCDRGVEPFVGVQEGHTELEEEEWEADG